MDEPENGDADDRRDDDRDPRDTVGLWSPAFLRGTMRRARNRIYVSGMCSGTGSYLLRFYLPGAG